MAHRKQKLEELIKRLISEMLVKELKDPRIGFVTITEVTLNKDLSVAEVGISILGNPRDRRKSFEGLKSSTGYIQHNVGKALSIRHTPKIKFYLDSSLSDGVSMVGKLESIVSDDKDNSYDEDDSESDINE